MKKPWVLSYPLSVRQRHWSDWVDDQADPRLCWAHRSFCWCYLEQAYKFDKENLTWKWWVSRMWLSHMNHIMRKPVYAIHANNKDASAQSDQHTDSILPLVSTSKPLASLCSWAVWVWPLSQTPNVFSWRGSYIFSVATVVSYQVIRSAPL